MRPKTNVKICSQVSLCTIWHNINNIYTALQYHHHEEADWYALLAAYQTFVLILSPLFLLSLDRPSTSFVTLSLVSTVDLLLRRQDPFSSSSTGSFTWEKVFAWSKLRIIYHISNITHAEISHRTKKNTAIFTSYVTQTTLICTRHVCIVSILSLLYITPVWLLETKDNGFGIQKTTVASVSMNWQQTNSEMKFGGQISAVTTTVSRTLLVLLQFNF